ncbi:MAG TPA: hypothetical protein VMG12_16350 [Polyangiaceae bacterium]|nr:hypothetical protein [Polyangiaceae bacterium]
MTHVYGDSTPFPYDVDYIDLSRLAVDCAVQLMSAQHAIATALERGESLGRDRRAEVGRINAMARAAEGALEPFCQTGNQLAIASQASSSHGSAGQASGAGDRIAQRMLECVKSTASAELAALEHDAAEEASHIRNIVGRSGESAQRALEGFLLRHDLPGTELSLSWAAAGEQGYAASVTVKTPFGIQGIFNLAIPPDHLWSRSRRVSDLSPGLEVHFPQQSGWLSKRVEMAPLKLDRLFLSVVKLDATSAEFRLRKAPSSGSGFRVLMTMEEERRVVIQPLSDEGVPDDEAPLTLDGDDEQQMLTFCARVVASTCDLSTMRRSMVSSEYEGEPLSDSLNDPRWPEAVAERLIQQLAPVVNEIAQRSGAPGELVLRRDVGGGRREEVYVTKAELYEKVLVLPPSRRTSFEQLGLYDPLRVSAPLLAAPAAVIHRISALPPSVEVALTPGPAQ